MHIPFDRATAPLGMFLQLGLHTWEVTHVQVPDAEDWTPPESTPQGPHG